MRDMEDIRRAVRQSWTGNAVKDLRPFLPAEREVAEREHDAESARRWETAERYRHVRGTYS